MFSSKQLNLLIKHKTSRSNKTSIFRIEVTSKQNILGMKLMAPVQTGNGTNYFRFHPSV